MWAIPRTTLLGGKLLPGDGLIVAVGKPYRRFVGDAVVASRYRPFTPQEIERLPPNFELDHGISLERVRVWQTKPWIDELWPSTAAGRTDPTGQFRQGLRSIESADAALIVGAGINGPSLEPSDAMQIDRNVGALRAADMTTNVASTGAAAVTATPPPTLIHRSDSAVQRAAEATILAAVAARLGVALAPRSFVLPNGSRVDVDGTALDASVLVEVFARQGALKGGQQKKVCQDALKLITLRHMHPNARLVIAFADEHASTYASSGTWVAEALSTWGVEVLVVEIDPALRARIREAQARQVMLNASDLDT